MEMTVPIQAQLGAVQSLLRDWVRYRRAWRPDNGYPRAVAWIDHVKGHIDGWTTGEDYDDKIHTVTMRHVDEAVKSLPSDCQHALNVIYLREIGPAVWRSGRKPMAEIRRICDQAESMLIPMLRRRDVL